MLDNILSTVQTVFGTADMTTQVIMLVIALAAGLALSRVSNIVNITVGALIAFGLARLALLASQGTPAASLPAHAWDSLGEMKVNGLVVYFVAFALVILTVYLVRSMMARRD